MFVFTWSAMALLMPRYGGNINPIVCVRRHSHMSGTMLVCQQARMHWVDAAAVASVFTGKGASTATARIGYSCSYPLLQQPLITAVTGLC
jgi:hypothetical protein